MNTHTTPIPEGYVKSRYEMNPDEESVLFGQELRPGMVILIESFTMRDNRDVLDESSDQTKAPIFREDAYEGSVDRFLETNRWCRIVRMDDKAAARYEQIHFIAEYADGTQRARRYGQGHTWLVKNADHDTALEIQ